MDYPLQLEGFDTRPITLEIGGFFSRAQILVEGKPAQRGPQPGQYVLSRDDGTEVSVQLQSNLLDPIPLVIVGGKRIRVADALSFAQQALAALSFGIALIMSLAGLIYMQQLNPGGGVRLLGFLSMTINLLLGGLLGFISMIINRRILRSEMSHSSKIFSIGAITIVVVIGFLVVFILLAGILHVLADLGQNLKP